MERRAVRIEGLVQGVGFRPFVYGLAHRLGLSGWVRNDPGGVTVEIEGEPEVLVDFERLVTLEAPELAVVEAVRSSVLPGPGERHAVDGERAPADGAWLKGSGFRIVPSRPGHEGQALVTPDVAVCSACLREMSDASDRRYGYPFLVCTQCGPRFTVVRSLPYDRANTTMSGFTMCTDCREEYENPLDRRFHAQPTACPACGPRLELLNAEGATVTRRGEALEAAAQALLGGRILAVKGLGGYHLACDAGRSDVVDELRKRKGREGKPFAVMVPDLASARSLAEIDAAGEELLGSMRAPVVLLPKREPVTRETATLAPEVAPGNRYVGVMLPYTPLHHLLLERVGRPLVMTSGNRSGEPIAFRDDDVVERLAGVADAFLVHDRPIRIRCDDSVMQVACGGPVPVRRSRGWVPHPLTLPTPSPEPLLALGGHLKNTFCLVSGRRAYLSGHVGDLDDPEVLGGLRESIAHLCALTGVEPTVVAHDLHPDYASTRLASELGGRGMRTLAVQHHHAHVAGCAAEHGVTDPVFGVAFDGSGYGPDGTVWGGEFLLASPSGYRRLGHLSPVLLPGGEAGVREPWRMALAHVRSAAAGGKGGGGVREGIGGGEEATGGGEEGGEAGVGGPRDLFPDVDPRRLAGVEELLRTGVSSPPTSSVGRLFDAVAALAGVRETVRFEAEAAMALEAAVDPAEHGSYPVDLVDGEGRVDGEVPPPWTWDPARIVQGVLRDRAGGTPRGRIAARFHNAVRDGVVAGCIRARAECEIDTVVLTGGVFLNRILTERAVPALEREGFRVLLHRRTPPGDGGLSFGQAVVAAARLDPRSHRRVAPFSPRGG